MKTTTFICDECLLDFHEEFLTLTGTFGPEHLCSWRCLLKLAKRRFTDSLTPKTPQA